MRMTMPSTTSSCKQVPSCGHPRPALLVAGPSGRSTMAPGTTRDRRSHDGRPMNAVVGLLHQLVVIRSSVLWHAHVDRDPFARLQLAEGVRDPYAIYAEVRGRGPVVPSPTMG